MLTIDEITVGQSGSRTRIEASIGGQPLFYDVPSERFQDSAIGDALLMSALPVAMLRGEGLSLPAGGTASPTLLANLPRIQRIFKLWNPRFAIVSVEAEPGEPAPAHDEALFFAGGVDSSYELLFQLESLTHLICMHGFDFSLSESEAHESEARLSLVAERYDTKLVIVTSNHSRFLARHGVSRLLGHGLTLGSAGCLLGFKRCVIASSSTIYEMIPWGSHPLLDHFYSNGSTNFEHSDNATSRLEKTRLIAQDPFMLDNLRVCWESHDENCGRCVKCLRTMAALEIIGVDGPFPKVANVKAYRRLTAVDEPWWTTELFVAARDNGQTDLARMLRQGLRLHDLRVAARYLLQGLLGTSARSLSRNRTQAKLVAWDQRPDLR